MPPRVSDLAPLQVDLEVRRCPPGLTMYCLHQGLLKSSSDSPLWPNPENYLSPG